MTDDDIQIDFESYFQVSALHSVGNKLHRLAQLEVLDLVQ